MDEKELQRLYDSMSKDFDVGDYNAFKARMQTPDDRKKFYDAVGKNGFDLGDYNAYETRIAGKKKDGHFQTAGNLLKENSKSAGDPSIDFNQVRAYVKPKSEKTQPTPEDMARSINNAPRLTQAGKTKKSYTRPSFDTAEEYQKDIVTSATTVADDYDKNNFTRSTLLGEMAAQGDEAAAIQLQEIEKERESLSTAEGISQYRQDRIAGIDNDIKELEKTPFAFMDDEQKANISALKSQRQKIDYSARRIAELAVTSEELSKYDKENYAINPRTIGRGIVQKTMPHFNDILEAIEKENADVGAINFGLIDRIGLDAMQNAILSDPEFAANEDMVNDVKERITNFDMQHPELTASRVKHKIAAKLYKDSNWFYNSNPSVKKIQEIGKQMQKDGEFTQAEVLALKDIVIPQEENMWWGTNVPMNGLVNKLGEGFQQSIISIGSLVDKTLLTTNAEKVQEASNAGLATRFEGVGEYAEGKQRLEEIKKKPASPETEIEKKELEKYVNIRNGWNKFVDGTGNLTGQVIGMGLTMKLVAGPLKVLGAVAEASTPFRVNLAEKILQSNTTASSVGGFLQIYPQVLEQATLSFPKEEDKWSRRLYAGVVSAVESRLEGIFDDRKVLNAFKSDISPAVKEFVQSLSAGAVTKESTKKAWSRLSQQMTGFGKEFVTQTNNNALEEAIQGMVEDMGRLIVDGEGDINGVIGNAVTTYVTTTMHSPLISGMAAYGGAKQKAAFKAGLYKVAEDPTFALMEVNRMLEDGEIDKKQAEEKVRIISRANAIYKELPKELDVPAKTVYTTHRLNESIIDDQLATATDEVMIEKLKAQKERSINIRKGIYDGSVMIGDNLSEVTADNALGKKLEIDTLETVDPDDAPYLATMIKNEQGVSALEEAQAVEGPKMEAGTKDVDIKTDITFEKMGIAEGDDFSTIVKKVSDYGGSLSEPMKFLSSMPGIENVKTVFTTPEQRKALAAEHENVPEDFAGLYHKKTNTFYTNPDFKGNHYYAAAHEAMHWLTLNKDISTYADRQKLKTLQEVFNIFSKEKGGGAETMATYGLKNFKEFVAEVIINPALRDHVGDILVKDPKQYKHFVDWAGGTKFADLTPEQQHEKWYEYIIEFFKEFAGNVFGESRYAKEINFDKALIDNAVKLTSDLFFQGKDFTKKETKVNKPDTKKDSSGPVTKKVVATIKPKTPAKTESKKDVKAKTQEKGVMEKARGIEDLTEPADIVMQHFAGGGKINPSAISDLFGGKDERLSQSTATESERKARIGIIQNDAPGIKELAHKLWEADKTGKYTDRDYVNAIEEVVQGFTSSAAMAKDLVERYINKAVKQELTVTGAKEIDDINIQKRYDLVGELPEEHQEQIVKLLEKYQDQYGFVDWEKLENDTNGFDPDILSLPKETLKSLYGLVEKINSATKSEPGDADSENLVGEEKTAGSDKADSEESIKVAQPKLFTNESTEPKTTGKNKPGDKPAAEKEQPAKEPDENIEPAKEASEEQAVKFSQKLRIAAQKIRDSDYGKIKGDDIQKMGPSFDLNEAVAVALEFVADAIDAGERVLDTIKKAVAHVKAMPEGAMINEQALTDALNESIKGITGINPDPKPQSGNKLELSKDKISKALNPEEKKKPSFISRAADFFKNISEYIDNPNRRITKLQHDIEKHYKVTTGKVALGRVFEQSASGIALQNVQTYVKKVLGGLSRKSMADLQEYVFAKRIIDRTEHDIQNKLYGADVANRETGNITMQDAVNVIADMTNRLGSKKMKDIEARAQHMQDSMQQSIERLVEAGVMSKEAYVEIKKQNDFYAPFNVVQELVRQNDGTERPAVASNIIKKIQGISYKDGVFNIADLERTQEAFAQGALTKEEYYETAVSILDQLHNQGRITDKEYAAEFSKLADSGFAITNIFDKSASMIYDSYRVAHKNELMNRLDHLRQFDTDQLFTKSVEGFELRYDKDGGAYQVPKHLSDIKSEDGFGVVGYRKDGKQEFMAIDIKAANVINGLDRNELAGWMKGINAINSFFRTAVITLSPSFQYANFVIDFLRTAAMSKYGLFAGKSIADTAANAVLFVPQYMEAIFTAGIYNLTGKKTSLYKDFMQSKGYSSGMYDNPFEATKRKIKLPPKNAFESVKRGIGYIFSLPARIGTSLEQSHKIVSTQRGMDVEAGMRTGLSRIKNLISNAKTPKDLVEALDKAAYETQNFAGSPNFPATHSSMKVLSVFLQFFSARVKGEMTDYRRLATMFGGNAEGLKVSAKERAQLIAQFTAVSVLPKVIMAMMNHDTDDDEDEFNSMSPYDRNNNMNIPYGTFEHTYDDGSVAEFRDYIKIPVRGLEATINTIANDFTKYTKHNEPDVLRHAIEQTLANITPVNVSGDNSGELFESGFSNLTPVLKWAIEFGLNRDTHRHRDLIPDSYGQNGMLAKYQRGEIEPFDVVKAKTPEWAIDLSRWLKEEMGISVTPITLDHMENTFAGNISEVAKKNTFTRRMLRSESNYPVYETKE